MKVMNEWVIADYLDAENQMSAAEDVIIRAVRQVISEYCEITGETPINIDRIRDLTSDDLYFEGPEYEETCGCRRDDFYLPTYVLTEDNWQQKLRDGIEAEKKEFAEYQRLKEKFRGA